MTTAPPAERRLIDIDLAELSHIVLPCGSETRNAVQVNRRYYIYLRIPGVARFIMGGLTTADLGARFLLAKNLCASASLG